MQSLKLADLKSMKWVEILSHIASSYDTDLHDLNELEFLIAYESVGAWGCDSSSFFLVRKENKLYEVNGSHCSCYGFKGQWILDETDKNSLLLRKSWCCGGYDDDSKENDKKVKNFLRSL